MTTLTSVSSAPAPTSAPPGRIVDAPPPRAPWAHRIIAIGCAAAIALYLFVAIRRVAFPYELEWMEGGVLGHVNRLRDGLPLYGPPTTGFVPYLYTPLFYVVGAAATAVLGVGLPALRAVSLVSSLALLVGIGALVRPDARSRLTPLIAAGLFAACFRLGGAWFDIAREDTLCLALLVWGLVVARRLTSPRRAAGAAVLLTLAFLTKQVALLPALAVIPYAFARHGRRAGVTYAGVLAAGIGGSTLVLQLVTHGWYVRYVFALPAKHELVPSQYLGFFTGDLLWPLPVVVALGAVGLVTAARRDRDVLWFHGLIGGALVASAYMARLHSGGYDNVVLPAFLEAAVLAAIGIERLAATDHRRWLQGAVAVLCLLQLGFLAYDPARQVPTAADGRAGDQLVAALRALPGPVYLPAHPWYAVQAGSPATAQSAAIEDVLRAHLDGTDVQLGDDLHQAIAEHRFGSIVVDSATGLSYLPKDLCTYYAPDHQLPLGGGELLPVTGTSTRPATVWLPHDGPSPDGCRPP